VGLYSLDDDPFGPPQSNVAEGVIASNPAADTDLLRVVVPALADDQALDDLRWMPRGSTLPVAGDSCLVVLTAQGSAWVAAWWPS
jgi:hypothetical protein